MVLLNRIYTRAGDGGVTRLANGEKVSKAGPRVTAYGEVDELNSVIGLARLDASGTEALEPILARVQNDLFDLGADLATPARSENAPEALRIVASQVERLEREIDSLNENLAPLTSFVLPGGTRLAANLHVARAVCRRAERAAVAFAGLDPGPHVEALRYLNRLSDLLFVAARFANVGETGDVLWVPAANRP